MKIIACLLFCILIRFCTCELRKCKNCAQRKSEMPLEQMRYMRYEFLKKHILRKLNLKEAPKLNLPKPPLSTLLVIAEMTENETVAEADYQAKTESVVIYPRDENLTCTENEVFKCNRFEFLVPESLSQDNFLSAEVWLYRKQDNFMRAFQIITDDSQNLKNSFELDSTTMETNISYLIKYNVLSINFRSNFTTENVLVIEVIDDRNETDSENFIGITADERPFLVIRSETVEKSGRPKRSATCSDSGGSCCKENFYLNFSEIGWDNWILHPDGYQANFCRGRCVNDLSNTRFYHTAVLLSYIRDNRDIAEEIGLNMCCTPSVMAPVTIIYRNEEDLIYHKSIENMKVEACDCA